MANFREEIVLLDEYRLGGYGEYDDEVRDCIRREYAVNGIPLDPVYTGKAFLGMKKFVEKAALRNSRILFLHTGGDRCFMIFWQKREK